MQRRTPCDQGFVFRQVGKTVLACVCDHSRMVDEFEIVHVVIFFLLDIHISLYFADPSVDQTSVGF